MLKTQWKTHFKEGGFKWGVFGCMKVLCDFGTQYCELQDETTHNGKSANAAFRCVKNQLVTRSGRLCGDKSVFVYFGKIAVANQKTHETYIVKPKITEIFVVLPKMLKIIKIMRYTFSLHIFVTHARTHARTNERTKHHLDRNGSRWSQLTMNR